MNFVGEGVWHSWTKYLAPGLGARVFCALGFISTSLTLG